MLASIALALGIVLGAAPAVVRLAFALGSLLGWGG